MEMFWGDRPQQRARRSLSTALWHIRRCFPQENPIQSDVHKVHFQFPGDVYLDVEAFEKSARQNDQDALQAAVDQYRGEFLPGFFDEWIIDERYRLQSLFEEALARLMLIYETQRNFPAALQIAQRLLDADNLREDAHRLLMRAYAYLGKRNAALKQYQLCREIIARELGTNPMAETIELYETILAGTFVASGLEDSVELEAEPLPKIRPPGKNPFDVALPDILAGRDPELEFLQESWRLALEGGEKLILVSGEGGVGKTHLLKTFVASLQQTSIVILWGRCYEFERLLPYQPIAEALRPLLTNISSGDIQQLPVWVSSGLAHLLPEITGKFQPNHPITSLETRKTASIEPGQEQTQLFHAIAYFLAELGSTVPLLMVLEDLHWATRSTFELLHYLIRNLAEKPVMLVGTSRQEAIGPQYPFRIWQQQLIQDGLARHLHLQRLSQAVVEMWIVEMSGAGERARPLAKRLFDETEGNPFFVVEMIKALFRI